MPPRAPMVTRRHALAALAGAGAAAAASVSRDVAAGAAAHRPRRPPKPTYVSRCLWLGISRRSSTRGSGRRRGATAPANRSRCSGRASTRPGRRWPGWRRRPTRSIAPAAATCPDRCRPWRWPPARLAGESASFADEAGQGFGVRAPARDAAAMDRLRQELSERLPGRGSLAERHAGFRRRHAVPPARVEAAFAAAVAWCRDAAAARLPLPAGEQITVRAADEQGWAGVLAPARRAHL